MSECSRNEGRSPQRHKAGDEFAKRQRYHPNIRFRSAKSSFRRWCEFDRQKEFTAREAAKGSE